MGLVFKCVVDSAVFLNTWIVAVITHGSVGIVIEKAILEFFMGA
jgi:hypothetical protein